MRRTFSSTGGVVLGLIVARVCSAVPLHFEEAVPTQSVIENVIHDGTHFVGVGAAGSVLTSKDGRQWTLASTATNQHYFGVCYGGGRYIAVGNKTVGAALSTQWAISVSTDLANWTHISPPGDGPTLAAVAYGNGRYVAVGSSVILTSTDGLSWTRATAAQALQLQSVLFAQGQFIAPDGSRIFRSLDGITWTASVSGASDLTSVAYGNGVFVAAGNGAAISTNGVNWTTATGLSGYHALALSFGAGQFVALASSSMVLSSADGMSWVENFLGNQLYFPSGTLAYGNGIFVGVGTQNLSSTVLVSTDTVAWSLARAGLSRSVGTNVVFGNGRFLMTGGYYPVGREGELAVMESPDGMAWTPHNSGMNVQISGAAYGTSRFVAVSGTALAISADAQEWFPLSLSGSTIIGVQKVSHAEGQFFMFGPLGRLYASNDGVAWTIRTSHASSSLESAAFGTGQYVVVGAAGTIITSPDGVTWTRRNSGVVRALHSVAFGLGTFVAVGDGGTVLTSPDGINWSSHDSSEATGSLLSIAFGNDTFVIAGASGIATSSEGVNWNKIYPAGSAPFTSVAYGNGRFVAIGPTIVTAVVAEPILSDVAFINGTFGFSISGEKGRIYRVQSTTHLSTPVWQEIGAVQNLNPVARFSLPVLSSSPRQFFRVLADP
jgi:hypothetical protein